MKKLFLLSVFFLLVELAPAQNTFNKGDKIASVGLGVGGSLGDPSYHYTLSTPFLYANFELGIVDHLFDEYSSIGVGGSLGFRAADFRYNDHSYNSTDVVFAGRGAFHYQLVDNLDTYSGIQLGFDNFNTNLNESGADAIFWTYSIFAGARYYFHPNFSVNAEVCLGITNLNVGISYKF